ncbi:MAG: SRPBCC family protein [Pseudomonadota bacterium]
MDRATEIELIEEILELHARKSAFLDSEVSQSPVDIYTDPDRFQRERDSLLRTTPQPLAHACELPEAGSFLRRDLAGLPVLLTRDREGVVHAFLNVCRHRGTRLVDEDRGCRHRFSCPYHAWTWDNRGNFVGAPHLEQGFPDLDRDATGLRRLGCTERHGFLWVTAGSESAPDVDVFVAGLAPDFQAFDADALHLAFEEERNWAVNWKILVEGGIEAYHFRVAHRDTIAPYFHDNLSSYRRFGPHLRSVLAKRTLTDLPEQPQERWRLREHAQLLYSLFPSSVFLVQADHVAWVQIQPLGAASTNVRISTLVPSDRLETSEDQAHWEKNHGITVKTLDEDFVIGERIQAGLESGANEHLTFGRFEGALAVFNQTVERGLEG